VADLSRTAFVLTDIMNSGGLTSRLLLLRGRELAAIYPWCR
jgi:hypothetical protein